MTDTPRTDFVSHESGDPEWNRFPNRFARMMAHACILERELTAEQERATKADSERENALRVLIGNGFVRCDIDACNCGSWHHRYGLPERLRGVKDMLGEAGHPLCNENGNLVYKALGELIAERDAANAKGHEAVKLAMAHEDAAKRANAEVFRLAELLRKADPNWGSPMHLNKEKK